MNNFFSHDGQVIGILEKIGNVIILSVLWIICSIPVITVVASTASLYYAVVKTVRKEMGYPVKEFFRMFSKCILKGIALFVILAIFIAVLILGRIYAGDENAVFLPSSAEARFILCVVYDALLVLTMLPGIYISPVLSRFKLRNTDILKMSFVMSIRYIYITALLIASIAVVLYLQYRILPMWTVVIMPGAMAYVLSFPFEYVMKRYIKVTKENEDEWFIF